MTRNLYNWSYKDVKDFLTENEFSFFQQLKGSHEAWIKYGSDGKPDRIVEVNYTGTSYPPKTLKIMIQQSGIAQDEWLKWSRS